MIRSSRLRRGVSLAVAVAASVSSAVACSDDPSGSVEAFCEQVRTAPSLATVVSGAFDADPTELGARLERADAAYSELRSAAPDEISDEVSTMVDLVDALLDALAGNGNDPEAAAAEVRAAVVDHPDASAASNAVVKFAADECGVELNPTVEKRQSSSWPRREITWSMMP